MADLDFSSQASPVASSDALDFSKQADPVKDVGALSMLGRQFTAGGGDILKAMQFVGDLGNRLIPTPWLLPKPKPDDVTFGTLAKSAQDFGNLAPDEQPDGMGAKIMGGAGRMVPNIAAALATGGESSLAGFVPSAVRAVPVLGRVATGIAAGAPTAAALTTEQAANLPEQMATGDKFKAAGKDLALNLAMAGLPVAVGSSRLVRVLTGGGLGYGASAASSAVQGQDQDQAQNIVGAMMGALLGQHSAEVPSAPLDPFIARYNASAGEPAAQARPTGPALLPAPDFAAQAKPVEPAPVPFDAQNVAEVFKADPRTALAALDPATLHQVAKDAGFDIRAGTAPAKIIDSLMGEGVDFLHSDVLPEYMAAVTPAAPTPAAPATTPEQVPGPSMASALAPDTTVPVDAGGTAYTPQQGASLMADALAKIATGREQLPAPVTTVDRAGTAVDSGTFLRKAQEAQAAADAAQRDQVTKRALGITPDIERTQTPRWKAQEAARADIQAKLDAKDAENGDLATQRTDDAPPWWLAGEHAADEHAQQEQDQIVGQREDDSPPWWLAGQYEADMWKPPVKDAAVDAVHADPGQKPEPVTPAVIGESVGKSVANTSLDRAAAKQDIIGKIAEAQKGANADPWPEVTGGRGRQAALNERQRIIRSAGHVSIDVPGDGKFQVVNNRQALDAFRAKVEKSPGFKKPVEPKSPSRPSLRMSPAERAKVMAEGGGVASNQSEPALDDQGTETPRERFLGKPKITSDANARDLVPRAYESVKSEASVPFDGGYTAKYSPHGAAVFDGDKVIASYNNGDTLVVDKKYRDQGIAKELVYQWRTRYPDAPPAKTRTKASQAIQEKVWDRIKAERGGLDDQGIEVREHSMDDNSPVAREAKSALQRDRQSHEDDEKLMEQMRQESRDQGERDATSLGIRDAVSQALGGLSGNLKVEFIRNEMGLPPELKLRPVAKGGRRMGTYSPQSKRVFIYTQTLPTKAEAAFTAAHEVYGHRAMRMLAEQHPDVKVGNMTAPEALNKALDAVLQNPTVRKVAASMGAQRKTSDPRLMAEEAMADLSAAAQTGNWDKIKTKHGVDVPEEMRAGVQGVLKNFIERLKRILNAIMAKITGKPASFTDAQVHEFMKDSANALREPEKAGGHGEAVDSIESDTPDVITPSMVKQALRNRGVSDEAIAGMSKDELRSEAASMRMRSQPTPEMKETGVKNATKEEERAMKGKAAVEHDLSTSNPEQYAAAKARFDADPLSGQMVAARVIAVKEAITPEDSILLSLDAMRIINARQSAYEQAEKAMTKGDEATRVAALSMVRQLDGQMEANDIASRYSGVRAGQALQARKVMIRQDYSMARMVLRAKVAKGEALTPAETARVEKAAAEIDRRTKDLDAREAKLRAMEAEARPVAQKIAAKAKFEDLAAQLKAIAQKDQMKPGCVA